MAWFTFQRASVSHQDKCTILGSLRPRRSAMFPWALDATYTCALQLPGMLCPDDANAIHHLPVWISSWSLSRHPHALRDAWCWDNLSHTLTLIIPPPQGMCPASRAGHPPITWASVRASQHTQPYHSLGFPRSHDSKLSGEPLERKCNK